MVKKNNIKFVSRLLFLFIVFIHNTNVVEAKINIESLTNFNNMPKNYTHTLILLGILFINLILGLLIGENIINNFNRIIKKEKITKSLIIEIIILLLIDIPLGIIDIQTLSLCIKALAASLIFGPILDNYQDIKLEEDNKYNIDLTNNEITKIDKTLYSEYLKEYVFNSYKEIQKSYMYEDYNNLKKYIDDNLYKQYSNEIKKLHKRNNKRIIKNITYIKANILKIYIKNNIENIDIYLNITKKDYISNVKKKKIVKGNKNNIYNIEYLITISRNINNLKCYNCNAPINITKDKKCEYCDQKISNNYNEFIITRKHYISKNVVKKDNNKAKEDKK